MEANRKECTGCPWNYKDSCISPKSQTGKSECYRKRDSGLVKSKHIVLAPS
jgi:protein-arginine kinase activator protein McsA